MDPLSIFSAETRAWFEQAFAGATPAQERGWPAIARGGNTLIQAPTGSGKTLAAFLYGIDRLNAEPGEGLRAALRLAVESAELRHRAQPARAARRAPLRPARGRPHRRHAAEGARRDGAQPARHPDHHARVALPAADLESAGDAALGRDGDRGRGARGRGARSAARTWRSRWSGSTGSSREPVQRIGLSATQRPLEEIGALRLRRRARSSSSTRVAPKELDLKVVVPARRHARARARSSSRSGPRSTPRSCELVRAHRSTIVFVNNRRLAERLALRLNELAEEEIARAHHGSLAREQRVEIEELLKRGRIPCLVATSSLELGIDMGAVDLVIQVESPKSVARGLQRIGRAGHELGAVSKGRIFPKFRADLLESAVVARRMRDGAIEETMIPRNPLDVLAQQIVAICADDEIAVDELHSLVRGAYPFARPFARPARERARHARRPLPVRRVRRAAAARGLGPHRRTSSAGGRARGGSRSRTRARSPTAASSASTSSKAVAGSASSTRRWSTRLARARRSCSARRPGASRRSRATACSSRRRRACRARCRSGRARASAARTSSARRSARPRASSSR